MECVELVQRYGLMILVVLTLFGIIGIGLHIWWSSKLKFFDFKGADSTKKGNLKRLFIPSILVSFISLLTPIVAVLVSSEFRQCLEDPEIVSFLSRFWVYILPVKGTGPSISALVCGFLGFIAYWIFGSALRLVFAAFASGGR
jgi:hypothetical protein